jgi:thioredoxin reductase (NADPH)
MEVKDCIIVGSGIAGISAALTLKATGKSFSLFGSMKLSRKISAAEMIRNYPGLPAITGESFCVALQNQLQAEEISVIEEKVTGVYALKEKFSVLTDKGNSYEAKTVILACGVESIKQIDGEEEFFGRGVSYCATCDGFLYKGKRIAIFCTSKDLEHEIKYLSELAEKVYLIPIYKNVQVAGENITIIQKMPKKIQGKLRAEEILFGSPVIGDSDCLKVDGIFMLRESVSPAVLVGGLAAERGHVNVGKDMSTNLKGCFAAGDCTGRPYQYAKAAGEGNVAAHSVTEYLNQQEN